MGVTAADFDGDGDEDILKTNLASEGTNLYINDSQGNFRDASTELGLFLPTFPYTGFGTEWFDYDNDGRLDLFIANGAVNRIESLRGTSYPFGQPNLLFHNEGDGKKFRDMTAAAGPAFALPEVSRGAAFGDIDNAAKQIGDETLAAVAAVESRGPRQRRVASFRCPRFEMSLCLLVDPFELAEHVADREPARAGEFRAVDTFAIEAYAILGTQVVDVPGEWIAENLRVPTRDRFMRDHDVASGIASEAERPAFGDDANDHGLAGDVDAQLGRHGGGFVTVSR
jgi:hypothetical protein